ncbi:MAG: hypothetical protein WB341_06755 [Terracidiphilus sp.]
MSKAVSYFQWSLEPYCIGLKPCSLRTGKRFTLHRLAVETGLSTELLLKLETGDCTCMESKLPLIWSAADKHRCRVLAGLPRPDGPAKPPD